MNREKSFLSREWILGASLLTTVFFIIFGGSLLNHLEKPAVLIGVVTWLFLVVLGSIISVVRHADHLAVKLGEPYGTLILTLAVTAIEVISISTMMLHGENNPTLVRDTLFSVIMIILNGMVGLSLLMGGWKHREQQFNLQGANAYLGVIIPLAVLTLMLPNHTVTTVGPTLSVVQEVLLMVMCGGLYIVFLVIQTSRHRLFFVLGETAETHAEIPHGPSRSMAYHTTMLLAYMAPLVFLTEQLAQPLDYLVEVIHAPDAVSGAIIAMLVATPEAVGAIKAARDNNLQRSMNIFLGSVLATIGLTVPSMLIISNITHKKIDLGLQNSDVILLPLTLIVSVVTFSSGRTNILQGAVHTLLFIAYIVLLFQG